VALATDKSVFLHIPKCCGIWIRHAFRVLKIPHVEIGDQHSHFPELFRYRSPQFFQDRFLFAFVRHPLTWYQSRWAFRVKNGWRAQHPLDYNCASNDFPTFVDNLLRYKPDGWFTWECRMFIDNCPKPIDFVGHAERLVDDFITALTLAGERVVEKAICAIPRLNDSDMDGKPSRFWAPYDNKLMRRVQAVERVVIDRYYADFEFNPRNLVGPRPY
jgi:hypothetical protein